MDNIIKGAQENTTLILSGQDVQDIITYHGLDVIMNTMIVELERYICDFDESKTIIPQRSGFNYTSPNLGLVEWMPLFQVGNEVTIKIVGYHPNNPRDFQLPTILSSISQYDVQTGHLSALIDGVLLTALRTGAASAVASKFMAKNDSSVLGLIGCGAQAITQYHALSMVFDFDTVLYYDIDPSTSDSFIERVKSINSKAEIKESGVEEIVASSDILCTATSIEVNEGPLFKGITTMPHLHINAVGSDFPGKVEIPMDLIEKSFLCPDFIDQALVEGECQRLDRDRIDADLAQIVKNPSLYASNKDGLTVFDSTGWTLEDHVAMKIFLGYAKDLGIGKEIELESIFEDSKDPYYFMNPTRTNVRTPKLKTVS